MILTTLTGLALAAYTAKTALALGKETGASETVKKAASTAADVVGSARDGLARALGHVRTGKDKPSDETLLVRILENASEDERKILADILTRPAR